MMANKPELVSELTPEDKLLIELLVDGELDDNDRKSLLIRLDHLNGGWRFCAITFLEAQCINEVLSVTGPYYQAPVKTSPIEKTPPVSVIEDHPGASSVDTIAGPWAMEGSTALSTTPSLRELSAEELSRELSEKNNTSDAFYQEPLIIPMHHGRYARKNNSGSGNGGSGYRGSGWRNNILAMVGGFFLAFLLSGILLFLISDRSGVRNNNNHETGFSVVENLVVPDLNSTEDKSPSSIVVDNRIPKGKMGDFPVKLVTLQSPMRNLDNVVIPCIESDDYNLESLKNFREKNSLKEVEILRKKGRDVETVYEDLAFPLKDGRVLIVPVDTYIIKTNKSVHYQ